MATTSGGTTESKAEQVGDTAVYAALAVSATLVALGSGSSSSQSHYRRM